MNRPWKALILILLAATLAGSPPAGAAISEKVPRIQYTSTGGTNYAFSFPIWAKTDLQVRVGSTLQTVDSQYTVTFTAGSESGGTVTFISAPAAGSTVTIVRVLPQERTPSLPTSGTLPVGTLNAQLDKLSAQIQDLREQSNRAVTLPAGTVGTLPATITGTPNRLLGTDSLGGITDYSVSEWSSVLDGVDDTQVLVDSPRTLADLFDSGYDVTVRPGAVVSKDPFVDVRSCGADASGVADSTSAVQACANLAASTGRPLYVPTGTYKVIATNNAWANVQYAIKPVGTNLKIIGDGPSSNIRISAHEGATNATFPVIFMLSGLTGTVTVSDLQISSPDRVNTTHNGPMAFSGGEMGPTAYSGPGVHLILDRVTISKCSFAVHGQRFLSLRMRDCNVTIQGGGTYSSYYSEGVNLGTKTDNSEPMDIVSIKNCTLASDGTYDDHFLYLISDVRVVEFMGNTVLQGSKNDLLKLDGLATSYHRDFPTVTVTGNTVYNFTDTFLALTGNGIANSVTVSNNAVPDGGSYFVYSNFFIDSVTVSGNRARSVKNTAVNILKNSALASPLGMTCRVTDNDFDLYNTLGTGVYGIKTEAQKTNLYMNNRLYPGNGAAGASIGGPSSPDCETIVAIGNVAGTATVPPWISYPQVQGMAGFLDLGNSWSMSDGLGTAAPGVGTWKRGDRVWNTTPSAANPPGWVCVAAGTPGTWKAMANLAP